MLPGRSDAGSPACEYVRSCLTACPGKRLDFWETMKIALVFPQNVLVTTSACERPFCPVISLSIRNVGEYYAHFMDGGARKPLSCHLSVGQEEKTESCFLAE